MACDGMRDLESSEQKTPHANAVGGTHLLS